MPHNEESPLVPLSESYILESCTTAPASVVSELRQIVHHYLNDVLSLDRASAIFKSKIGTSLPLLRISRILSVPGAPIQPRPSDQRSTSARRKTHIWTEYEDQRLLYALHAHGFENWGEVAQFVGNGRTRAQCSQRWFRGLDPRISRVVWTPEEEQRLINLVRIHGQHSWMRIATELGRRSDSQCRYHYYQIARQPPEAEMGARISGSSSAPIPRMEPVRNNPLMPVAAEEPIFLSKRSPLPHIVELIGEVESQKWRNGYREPENSREVRYWWDQSAQ
jgi:hypothetical protein